MMSIKTYSELISLPTFKERYEYLKLDGVVGDSTFGFDRYVNQYFYKTKEWQLCRSKIIIRDNGCDLGCEGFDIIGKKVIIHHINPIALDDLIERRPIVFDPENLITTTHSTHNAIHYGDESLLNMGPIKRTKNDTCPWKH